MAIFVFGMIYVCMLNVETKMITFVQAIIKDLTLILENNEFFEGEVIHSKKNYALISADYATDGKINGFAINGYFLDGFIPLNQDYYLNYYGIISKDYCSTLENNNIEMQIYSGNQSISALGLAFSLSFNKPLIKIIPLQYGEYFLKEGDIIKIKINLKW